MKKEEKKALNQVKQLCDFMLDETGMLKFEQTGIECLEMLECLLKLEETVRIFLKKEFRV